MHDIVLILLGMSLIALGIEIGKYQSREFLRYVLKRVLDKHLESSDMHKHINDKSIVKKPVPVTASELVGILMTVSPHTKIKLVTKNSSAKSIYTRLKLDCCQNDTCWIEIEG